MSSGEANISHVLSLIDFEETSVVVTSSPEFCTVQKLAHLHGGEMGVTSALLTSTVALRWAHNLWEDFVQPIEQTVLLSVDRVVVQHCGGRDMTDENDEWWFSKRTHMKSAGACSAP